TSAMRQLNDTRHDHLFSSRHEPSQSAPGGSFCNSSMRLKSAIDGPSPGTASRAAAKALRASCQRCSRYAARPTVTPSGMCGNMLTPILFLPINLGIHTVNRGTDGGQRKNSCSPDAPPTPAVSTTACDLQPNQSPISSCRPAPMTQCFGTTTSPALACASVTAEPEPGAIPTASARSQ